MKKFLKIMVAVLVCLACFLTACGPAGLGNNPADNLTALGNGGMAVVKGEYLYYVNGYQDYKEFTKAGEDNKFGTITRSGIYRTKLVNGKVQRDENGFLVETECVVPQSVGYEFGGFYIVGNYIYYLTPHMQNGYNAEGVKELKNKRADVCRINIDGTGQKKLASTTSDDSVKKWTVYTIDNKAFIVLQDGSSIISVDGDNGNVITMAENVTSVDFAEVEDYTYKTDNISGNQKYIYYTREYTEDDAETGKAGNKLCRVEIGKSDEEVVATGLAGSIGYNYSIIECANGYVYYTKVVDTTTVTYAKEVYRKSINNNASEEYVSGEYSGYVIIKNNTSSVANDVIAVDSNNYIFLISNGVEKLLYRGESAIKLIGEDNGNVYYICNSKLYTLSFVDNDAEPVEIGREGKTYKLDDVKYVDLDGRRLFVYSEYTGDDGTKNYYLNIIDAHDKNTESDFVGKFEDGETPKEPETKTNDEGEDITEIWVK
ncbi:MAG: hypothetical protein E7361_03035 [Clostridiales bacterium]|nr:hypothetical protein [Clostridiales bacterium]